MITSKERVKISIGIPVFNEEKNIGHLLKNIISSGISFEIIVVSSGSTDATDEIVLQHDGVKLIKENCRRGKVSAIKKIIDYANGDIILFTDGDVELDKNSINNILDCFNDLNVMCCTGRVLPIIGSSSMMNHFSGISCEIWDKLRNKKSSFIYPTGYLHAVRLKALKSIDIENSVINDDAVIGLELYKMGIKYNYCRNAVVRVKFPDNISDFFKQKIRTRLGRRQVDYLKIFKYQEQELSKELIYYIFLEKGKKKYYGLLLYIFDWFSKLIATYKSKYISDDAHLWKEIKSTKNLK